MPFEIFRRHQKKMLAALAILAMVAFSLDFSLLRGRFGGGSGAEDPVVATLYGRRIHRSDLLGMLGQRSRANRFMAYLAGGSDQEIFGGLDTRSLVDALILEHEADKLGLPADRELAVRWLREQTQGGLTTEVFDRIYRQFFAEEVTDAQLLEDIANQIRLVEVQSLPGRPPVTPLDVFRAYQDQYERVSAKFVAFSSEQYLDQVAMPGPDEVQDYYARYKDALPDARRDTPGFKVPRRLAVEYVMADPGALAEKFEPLLTDAELREAFEARKDEFPAPAPELPQGVFAGEPGLTPELRDPFREVRPDVARRVARERADELTNRIFDRLMRETFEPFTDQYLTALEANQEAEPTGGKKTALPDPGAMLKQAVDEINQDPVKTLDLSDAPRLAELVKQAPPTLTYEKTPALDQELAGSYGPIGSASRGGGPLETGTPFAEIFFDSKRGLYEDIELADAGGRRFLVWKVADEAAYVPPLDQIRDQVVRAWRLEKARELALKAAQSFAAKVRQPGNNFDALAQAEGRPVVVTSPVPRLQPGGFLGSTFQPEPARPSEIPQLPDASSQLLASLFTLQPNQAKVEPNQSKTIYYVLALNDRLPVSVRSLYSEFGPRLSIELAVQSEANAERYRLWMNSLRAEAGLPTDWIPPDEAARAAAESNAT